MSEGVQDVEITREIAVTLLRPYVEAREQETIYGRDKSRLAELIKHYLEASGDADIYDGERGLVAHFQQRSGGDSYDLQRAPDDLILLLHKLNLLTVNVAGVKAQEGLEAGERLKPYKVPGKGTTALIVESKK